MGEDQVQLSREDLEGHLREQLQLLRASAESYDRGLDGEAKRMATNLRILLHDSRTSHSLLGQLKRLGGRFLSTAFPTIPGNLSTHGGLVVIGMKGSETRYLAMLDDVPFRNWLPVDEWWNEVVFVDNEQHGISRRRLVLVAADQDGGAHVDPSIDATYHNLTKRNSLGWVYSDGTTSKSIPLPERAAIRQITHEVLVSLLPGYHRQPDHKVDIFVGHGALVEGSTIPALPRSKVTGRNELCPCGSGRKYKKCHGS